MDPVGGEQPAEGHLHTVTHMEFVLQALTYPQIGINDAPRADEMLLALVMTTGARIHARTGGLQAADIKGEDGLR